MSQKRAILLLLLMATFIGAFFAWSVTKQDTKQKVKNEQLSLKISRFTSMDSSALLFPENQFIVLVYFNSECILCQNEALEIQRSLHLISNTRILMVSSEPIETIRAFSVQHVLQNEPSVMFAKINTEVVFDTFGSVSIPHIFIYDKEHKLIKEFKGETKMEAILQYLPK
jgi:thioredoxin-related protein